MSNTYSSNPYSKTNAVGEGEPRDEGASFSTNPYRESVKRDKLLLERIRRQKATEASMTDAGKAKRTQDLSERSKIPAQVLEGSEDQVEQELRTRDIYQQLGEFDPEEQQWLTRDNNLAVLQEDLPRLKALTKAVKGQNDDRSMAENILRGANRRAAELESNFLDFIGGTANRIEQTFAGSLGLPNPSLLIDSLETFRKGGREPDFIIGDTGIEFAANVPPEQTKPILSDLARQIEGMGESSDYRPQFTAERIKEDPTVGNIAGFMTEQGLVSLPDMVGVMLSMPAYASSRTQELAEERLVNEGREGPVTSLDIAKAAPGAIASSLIERFATARLFNPVTKTAAGTIATATAREAGTEFVQEQLEYAGSTVGTDKGFDVLESLERGAFGALAGAGMGGAISSVQQVYSKASDYNRARKGQEFLRNVTDMANEARQGNATKDQIREIVGLAKQKGPVSELYIDANEFNDLLEQNGLDPETIAKQMPSVTEQFYEARAVGGDLAISLEDFAATLSDTAAADGFLTAARTDPRGMSGEAAQRWLEGEAQPMLERAMAFDPESEREPIRRIAEDVTGQLLGVGYDQGVAEAEAERVATTFARIASIVGDDPVEFYQQYGPRIQRPEAEAGRAPRQTSQLDNMLDRLRAGEFPKGRDIRGPSLVEFLREQGGIVDEGGELAARDVDVDRPAFARNLIQRTGMFPDGAAERAAEAGYIDQADPNALFEAIDREVRGEPIYSPANLDTQLESLEADLQVLDEELSRAGIDMEAMSNEEIVAALEAMVEDAPAEGADMLDQMVERAREQGYAGKSAGEAATWLAAQEKGLDMSEPARLARAQGMGFDTDTVLYHGTTAEFTEFSTDVPTKFDGPLYGVGVYLTNNPENASWYAEQGAQGTDEAGSIIPVFVKEGPFEEIQEGRILSEEREQELRDQGYVGVKVVRPGMEGFIEAVIFNPEDIRSIHAAFDPEAAGSADLLAQDAGRLPSEGKQVNVDEGYQVEEVTDDGTREAIRRLLERRRQDREGDGQPAGSGPRAGAEGRDFDRSITGREIDPAWRDSTRILSGGEPAVVFRGSANGVRPENFGEDQLGGRSGNPNAPLGVWFTSKQSEAERTYGGDAGVVDQVHLDIRKPKVFKLNDVPEFDSPDEAWRFREKLREQGYDGIVFDYREDGYGVHFAVFDADQVIVPQQQGDQLDQDAAPEAQPRLSALHNLSADNLIFADQMGGIAVPSIAVTTEDQGDIDGFGEITLIGGRDLGSPEAEPVFDSDAYSQRFPRPEYGKVKVKQADAWTNKLEPWAQKFGDPSVVHEVFDYMVNTPDAQSAIDKLLYSEAARAWFLSEQGIDVEPVERETRLAEPWVTDEQFQQWLEENGGLAEMDPRDNPELYAEFSQQAFDAVRRYYRGKKSGRPEKALESLIDGIIENMTDSQGMFSFGKTSSVSRSLKESRSRTTEVDRAQTRERIEEKLEGKEAEFKQWVEDQILPLFPEPKIKVGGRKVPYTLENIVEHMTRQRRVQGREQTMTFSPGQARANASQRFKDLESMREAARENILSPEEISKARKEADELLEKYREKVIKHFNGKDWRGNIDTFEALDSSMRAIAKVAGKRRYTEKAMKDALRSEDFNVADMPSTYIDQGIEAAKAMMKAPVPYFEAKPQRAVKLSEFSGAVVPRGTSEKVRSILQKNGIEYVEYAEGERQQAIRELRADLSGQGMNVLFQDQPGRQVPQTETPEFRRWFGDSKVVDESGEPLVVYHGTGNTDSIYDGGFNPEITGKGMDQLGSGFYFTTDPDEARGYETAVTQNIRTEGGKLGGDQSPGTVDVYLSIKNPIVLEGSNLNSADIDLTEDQAAEIIRYSESAKDPEGSPFGDFFEEYWEGGTQEWMYDAVAPTYVGQSLMSLENDFFKGEAENFRRALNEVLGYDGVVQEFEGGKKHFVAWFPEQIKSATGNRGTFDPASPNILEQRRRNVPRGAFFYDAMDRAVIQLGEASDLTTLPHETYHLFLDVLNDVKGRSPQIQQELDIVRDWLARNTGDLRKDAVKYAKQAGAKGIADRIQKMDETELKSFYQDNDLSLRSLPAGGEQRYLAQAGLEYFARGGEAYLMTGKAPSNELSSLFRRLKQWFLQVYESAKELGVKLDDDIVGVFDRMLATEEQIEQAQETAEYGTSMVDIEALEWTDEEREKMAELTGEARDQAEAILMREQIKDMQKRQQDWWEREKEEVRREVLDELNKQPVYQARAMLTAGTRADGSPLPEGVEPFKLDRAMLEEEFGAEYIKRLPSPKNPGNKASSYTYTRKGGEDPSIVARLYGFDSARSLVEALIESRPIQSYVDSLVEAEMRSRHPNINLSGEASQIALEAVYNDKQAQVMLAELRKLEAKTGARETIPQMFRNKAREMVRTKAIKDIRPDLFERKATKFQREATQLAMSGRLQEALEAKQRALMHHYLYKEAYKARDEAEKIFRYAKRLTKKPAQERIGKAGADYLERINEILGRYEFRRISGRQIEKRKALRDWAEEKAANGEHVDIPEEVLTRAQNTNWRAVSLDELSAMRDALKNLEHVARFKSRLLSDKAQRELQDVVDGMVAKIEESQKARKGKGFFEQKKLIEDAREAGWDYAGVTLNIDTIVRQLDGWEDVGPVYDAIKRPIDEAARSRLPAMQEKYGQKMADMYNKYFTRAEQRAMVKPRWVEVPGRGWVSREQALAVALNWGNEYNREAVMAGVASARDKLGAEDVRTILDSLTKNDWDFVQDVWDMMDFDFWPQVKEAQKRRTGIAPEKVQASPVQTKFGVYRGGYYPVKFDRELGWRVTAQEAEEMAQQVRMGSFANAQTARGHTIARVGTGGQPLKLDLGPLHGHLNQVMVDLALGDAINDVSKVINHRDFVAAMERTGNTWAVRALDSWLKDVAAQEVVGSDILSRVARRIRTGFTVSKLAWNLGTIAIQPTGLAQSIPDVGYGNMKTAIQQVAKAKWVGEGNIVEQVRTRSEFMRTRGASFNKDIDVTRAAMKGSGVIEAMLEKLPLVGRGVAPQKASELIKDSLMGGIVAVQQVVDTIVWLGAYEKGKQTLETDADALQYADNVVARTQASGIFSDRMAFERGSLGNNTRQSEFVRLWTVLGSYMFAKGNLLYERTRKTNFKDPVEILKYMHDMFLYVTFEAIFIGLMRNLLPDDDDDETVAGYLAKESALTVLGTMPLVRDGASVLQGFQGGGALGGFWEEVGRAGVQLEQGEIDAPLLKTLNNVGGTVFRYPAGQTNRIMESLWRDMTGEDVQAADYLIWRQKED